MAAGASGAMGSETDAGGTKPMNPATAQRSADLRARMQAAMPQGNGMMTPGGAQNMRPGGQGMQAMTGGPGGTPLPPPAPPPGGWGTAMAGAPPGGTAPMGGAPAPGWLQQFMQQAGGVPPASTPPAQRPATQPTQTQPGQTVTGGGMPMAGNFFGTGAIPKGFGDSRPAQAAGGQKAGMPFFQQASKGWGMTSSGKRRYMGGSQ